MDDLVLANTHSIKILLHSLEQVAKGIGLYICFKQYGAISTLNGKPLKLINYFTYLGCNISSVESDVNIGIDCYW